MMISWKFFLTASFVTAALTGPVQGGLILDTMPTNPGNAFGTRTPGNGNGGITTKITVGSSNVTIGSFATYGQLLTTGDLKWVIFSAALQSGPIFSTASTPTTAATAAQWYVSPEIDFTLNANTTYYLGVIADQNFVYHYDFPGTAVTSGGLTAVSGDNGNTGSSYANPIYTGDGAVLNSFEAFTPSSVPEPASVVMLGTAALIGFIYSVRKRWTATVA